MSQISIVKLSEVEKDGRFDAEFYKPEYLEIMNTLNKLNPIPFQDNEISTLITDGDHGNPEYDSEGIDYLKVEEVSPFGVVLPANNKISFEYSNKQSKKNYVRKNDVLITTVGTIGKVCVVDKEINAVMSRDIAKISLKNISPFLVQVFLQGKFGKSQMERTSVGGLQQGLYLTHIKQIKIPLLPTPFQQKIESLVKDSYQKLQTSKSLYKEAEEILLKELNLEDYKPKHELTFRANLKEVLESERIDADYFQPKYKEIEKRIEGYKGGFFNLSNEEIINKNFFPKLDKEYCYIELSNVSENGEINGFTKDLGANLPTRARRKLKEGDVIISSIQGSLNSCALITKYYENCLCSNGFFVLNSNKLNPETLLVLAKSLIIQRLLERGCKGTILTAIGKNELQKIKIPLLPSQIQNKISEKIQESFKLRKEAKELLEKAKQMVEDEIEKTANK